MSHHVQRGGCCSPSHWLLWPSPSRIRQREIGQRNTSPQSVGSRHTGPDPTRFPSNGERSHVTGQPQPSTDVHPPEVGTPNKTNEKLEVTSAAPIAPATPTTSPEVRIVTSYPGFLDYPENVMTSFPVAPTSGELAASASWQGGATLELSLSCDSATQTSIGTTDASVSIMAMGKACTANLSEVGVDNQYVPFTVTITRSAS